MIESKNQSSIGKLRLLFSPWLLMAICLIQSIIPLACRPSAGHSKLEKSYEHVIRGNIMKINGGFITQNILILNGGDEAGTIIEYPQRLISARLFMKSQPSQQGKWPIIFVKLNGQLITQKELKPDNIKNISPSRLKRMSLNDVSLENWFNVEVEFDFRKNRFGSIPQNFNISVKMDQNGLDTGSVLLIKYIYLTLP